TQPRLAEQERVGADVEDQVAACLLEVSGRQPQRPTTLILRGKRLLLVQLRETGGVPHQFASRPVLHVVLEQAERNRSPDQARENDADEEEGREAEAQRAEHAAAPTRSPRPWPERPCSRRPTR